MLQQQLQLEHQQQVVDELVLVLHHPLLLLPLGHQCVLLHQLPLLVTHQDQYQQGQLSTAGMLAGRLVGTSCSSCSSRISSRSSHPSRPMAPKSSSNQSSRVA